MVERAAYPHILLTFKHDVQITIECGERLFDDLGRLVSGSIVNDDQFDAWIGLCLHAHQCFAHVLRVVV